MRIEPSVSFRGALQVLGQFDRPTLTEIDASLGGVVFGASAAIGDPFVGLIDPANEVMAQCRRLMHGLAFQLAGTTGLARYQLIEAAHTIVVVASFFDTLRTAIGPRHAGLKVSTEGVLPGPRTQRQDGRGRLAELMQTRVAMPWSGLGFEANLQHRIAPLYRSMAERSFQFFRGLPGWQQVLGTTHNDIVTDALVLYRDGYADLVGRATEFAFWADLAEHTQTHQELNVIAGALTAIRADTKALASLESLLRHAITSGGTFTGSRVGRPDVVSAQDIVAAVNASTLRKPVLAREGSWYGETLRFPSVEEIHVMPRFRFALADPAARMADESWWLERPVESDLNLFLAAHFASPESIRRPIVILGHPGAGKSLLATVLAARLPREQFVAICVALRRVHAYAPVYQQVQEALDESTSGRVKLNDLVTGDLGGTRVVLFDGLDELMLASGASRARYLFDVQEFQDTEFAQGAPVAAAVTCRTVVADRLAIPAGSLLVKLEDFDDRQIDEWLSVWNQANLDVPRFRPMTSEVARHAGELARQPLLLLMLALYASNPENEQLDSQAMSSSELYQALVDTFIRRELDKEQIRGGPRSDVYANLVDLRFHQLAIAALAMFNRSRQFLTEEDLRADLAVFLDGDEALSPVDLDDPLDHAAATLARFFFIHSPPPKRRIDGARQPPRTYEFLHATFGEFMVASRIMRILRDLAQAQAIRALRRSTVSMDLSELRALLSHQPLVKNPRILSFAAEIWARYGAAEHDATLETLTQLINSDRRNLFTESMRYATYVQAGGDPIKRFAVYSVNLVTLRLTLPGGDDGVPLDEVVMGSTSDLTAWRAMVALWRSCLDVSDWEAICNTFDLRERLDASGATREVSLHLNVQGWHSDLLSDFRLAFGEARITGQHVLEAWIRSGIRSWRRTGTDGPEHAHLHETLLESLMAGMPLTSTEYLGLIRRLGAPDRCTPPAGTLLLRLLERDASSLDIDVVREVVTFAIDSQTQDDLAISLAAIVIRQPKLLPDRFDAIAMAMSRGAVETRQRAAAMLAVREREGFLPNVDDLRRLRAAISFGFRLQA
ncbi:hypothetical protein [Dactylosporangium sp. NPDC050588]|uniref:NACHT domain-containing protein n=1 Tax=Dactylosporangium sp. NPDC050588 TaxID=3157211 RepID=UPI0033CF4D74